MKMETTKLTNIWTSGITCLSISWKDIRLRLKIIYNQLTIINSKKLWNLNIKILNQNPALRITTKSPPIYIVVWPTLLKANQLTSNIISRLQMKCSIPKKLNFVQLDPNTFTANYFHAEIGCWDMIFNWHLICLVIFWLEWHGGVGQYSVVRSA